MSDLNRAVNDFERSGSVRKSLGIVEMPEGYALMLNSDYSHFYWVREDGESSAEHWDK